MAVQLRRSHKGKKKHHHHVTHARTHKKKVKHHDVSSEHRGCLRFFIPWTFFVFILVVVFGVFTSGLTDPVLFKRTVQEVYDSFPLDFTPHQWVFYIWDVIAVWLFTWFAYALTLCCRRPGDGKGYLYYRPNFMPVSMYACFSTSLMFVVAWITLWTFELLEISFGMAVGATVFGFCAMGISAYGVRRYGSELVAMGNDADMRAALLLGTNGLGLYSMWVLITTLQNLNIIMVFQWSVSDVDAPTVSLVLLGFLTILYFILDVLAFTVALRWVLTPYIVFVVTLAAMLSQDFDTGDRNFLLTLFLIGFGGFTIIFKLAAIFGACVTSKKKDRHEEEEDPGFTSPDDDDEEILETETETEVEESESTEATGASTATSESDTDVESARRVREKAMKYLRRPRSY